MKWTKEYRCVKCAKVLTYNQISRSHGCCPFCGHVSTGTFCDTVQNAILGPIDELDAPITSFILRWADWIGPILGTVAGFLIIVSIKSCEREEMPKSQTVLNMDEMSRKWNATPTYFLATSNHVTVQDTTSYGVTTLKVQEPEKLETMTNLGVVPKYVLDTSFVLSNSSLFEFRSNGVPVVVIRLDGNVEYDTNNVGEATRYFWRELSWHLKKSRRQQTQD